MSKDRKGIILAGGSGTRLYPLTKVISKQLLPVYDKPMIYYPLSTLMMSGIREILIISTERDIQSFKNLLGDGGQWGISLSYEVQKRPEGIAQAFLIAENFLSGSPSALILGDNIFHGNSIQLAINRANSFTDGASVFAYYVKNPKQYGVISFDKEGKAKTIIEKPKKPKTNYAVTGLYLYDGYASEIAKSLKPSSRGELEITDLNLAYLRENKLSVEILERGDAWFDTGTHQSLLDAQQFVHAIENRDGLKIACPEEIAYVNSWIDDKKLRHLSEEISNNEYSDYLLKILNNGLNH
ncbi:MAG: glucose-1-phosphate thymidylyltransferase [Chloroflexi bacterium]|nr:glucose-1-phosphate thymidylyltransferase [Chloroflexota bacterium]|tara:strand:+ start:339 stop:1229 length:891 start_codon:yes stop_codon:yes gene_type:complete